MTEAEKIASTYTERYWKILYPIAAQLEQLLRSHLDGQPRVDRISARAKSPERFLQKAAKSNTDGKLKYAAPLEQIQDQLGARIVVYYSSDVAPVASVIESYYRHIERREIMPDDSWTFGYTGSHFILALPSEAIPSEISVADAPQFFELQIKTLWQHAWSEANHDLGYKPSGELSVSQQRLLAFTAAQAWGADRVFAELLEQLQP